MQVNEVRVQLRLGQKIACKQKSPTALHRELRKAIWKSRSLPRQPDLPVAELASQGSRPVTNRLRVLPGQAKRCSRCPPIQDSVIARQLRLRESREPHLFVARQLLQDAVKRGARAISCWRLVTQSSWLWSPCSRALSDWRAGSEYICG